MHKHRRGATLIEATLVLMVFLTLMFSIFDLGFVLFEHHTLLHQARTAARYGAINPDDLVAIQNIVLYGSTAAPHDHPPGVFGLQSSMVNVDRADDWTPEDRIVITVSGYHYTLVTPFVAGVFTGRPIAVSVPVEVQ
jgi:hypothetical protein